MATTPGDRLRVARLQAGLDQKDVAAALDIAQNAVSMWERNYRRIPSNKLAILASLLHVSTDFLVGVEEPAARPPDHDSLSTTPRRDAMDWIVVGQRMAQARQARGWTVAETAAQVGVDVDTWTAWETGTQPVPLDRLDRAARTLGIALSTLIVKKKTRRPRKNPLDHRIRDLLPIRDVPILGRIVAGIPLETQPDQRGTAWVSEDTPGDFALEVHGDSMMGAGIHEGDLVIAQQVEAWEGVPPNSMVVALVDGETTLKYLIREPDPLDGDQWWLRAANPAYSDRRIDPTQDRVQGIVTSIQTVRPPVAPSSVVAAEDRASYGLLNGLTPEQRQLAQQMIEQMRRANKGQ